MLSQATRSRILKKWDEFINPQDLQSAYICTITFLRLAGLFPYEQNETGYRISYVPLVITFLHFSVYSYVNTSLLLSDLMALAKPIIMDSSLGIAANLAIRLLGIVISVVVFLAIFTSINSFTIVLNRYIVLMNLLAELGIETSLIFKKMFLLSATATLTVFLISLYLLAHSYFFYEKIANEKASMRFFYVVVIANYYQNVCLYAMGSYLFTVYLIQSLLNRFLEDVLHRQMEENEVWSRRIKSRISLA